MDKQLRHQLDKLIRSYTQQVGLLPGEKFDHALQGWYCAPDSTIANPDDKFMVAFSTQRVLIHRASWLAGWWIGPRLLIPLESVLSVSCVDESNNIFQITLALERHATVRFSLPVSESTGFLMSLCEARARHINKVSKDLITQALSDLTSASLAEQLIKVEEAAAREQFSPVPHAFCAQIASAVGNG